MTKTHMNILAIIFLYCAIFAWMSVPFVTTDKSMLRRQVMFIDQLQENILTGDKGIVSADASSAIKP